MKQFLKKLLTRLTDNLPAQRMLLRNVTRMQLLMGIGSGGFFDSSGEEVLAKLLREAALAEPRNLCVLDVGANQGQFLQMLKRQLQTTSCTVHCFEPSAHTFAILSNAATEFEDVLLNNCALGATSGEATLHYDEPGSGLASLTKRRLDYADRTFTHAESVSLTTLDDYCQTRGIQRIDLLKLDVEGHELDVLQGGLRMFQERRVDRVSFEFGGANIDTRTFLQDFWYFFQEQGAWRISRITPTGLLVPLERYSEAYEQFRTTNFVAERV